MLLITVGYGQMPSLEEVSSPDWPNPRYGVHVELAAWPWVMAKV